MTLSYKARRRWSLVVLLVGLRLYIAAALFVVSLFDRPPFWVELIVYIILGFLWMLPLKKVFLGVGKPDPETEAEAKAETKT